MTTPIETTVTNEINRTKKEIINSCNVLKIYEIHFFRFSNFFQLFHNCLYELSHNFLEINK